MKKDLIPMDEANNELSLNNRKFLDGAQIEMINEALEKIGDFGEIRLVVQNGRLRFIVTQKSMDALNWKPGNMKE
jgi:hypothetical protein